MMIKYIILYALCVSAVYSCFNFKLTSSIYKKPSDKHIAALVLARGGSVGIPLKNIQKINEFTLLGLTLHALKATKGFSSIWVSTDHDLIVNEAEKFNINIHWRSRESATNKATSLFAVQEFLKNHNYIDIIALVQCTSPFINNRALSEALNLIETCDCVFSVTKSLKLRWRKIENRLVPLNFDPKNRPRRQDFEEYHEFVENGMFYFAKRSVIENGLFQSSNCNIVEIPKYFDMEIDNYQDLIVARKLWKVL